VQPDLTLRIVLAEPPAGVDYGLQVGRGADYETAQTRRAEGGDVSFEFTVGIKDDRPAAPDFRGPIVQGAKGQRFVYIDIGTYAGQTDTPWSRRLKVPLAGITWDVIERASSTGIVVEARVPGTARDGGPACATVHPVGGWKVAPSGRGKKRGAWPTSRGRIRCACAVGVPVIAKSLRPCTPPRMREE